mmetsp:Transcript_21395/g.59505  ORF Transcript_21395/g.59505 Transcript_21395/m.59505 type:complete len:402 (-) Transcript_21395:548-1753(-)
MTGVFLVAAKRTPFGTFGGSLKSISATDLGTHATKAALASIGLDPSAVDSVFFGNVIQTSPDAAYLARHVGLKSGTRISAPSLTVNRLCGSGFESVVLGAQSILLGESAIAVCGGAENMSDAPLCAAGNDARWGVKLGAGLQFRDSLWDGLTDAYAKTPMGITAENLAKQYGITREECDAHALRSQRGWADANEKGLFDAEIAPIEVPGKKRGATRLMDTDEHPRPDATLESLQHLPAVFDREHGVVTAANASGINDGAGSIIVASEQALIDHDLTPLCRLAGYGIVGCDPKIMGIGPVPAIREALSKAGDLSLENDVDRVEINEAFAAQFLACAKELNLDMDKTNVHGSAIAIGHPLGASGSRITAHLAHAFANNPDSKIHVGAACIGGGQGIAVVLERV